MFFRHSLFFLYVAFLPRFFGKFRAAFSVDAYTFQSLKFTFVKNALIWGFHIQLIYKFYK